VQGEDEDHPQGAQVKLRPYQEQAVTFIYERDRSLVLAPVGAGKTAITLAAMQELLRDGVVTRWLVVAPKRVCTDVWPVEQPKWAPGLRLAVGVGSAAQRRAALTADVDAVVINYDNLDKLTDLKRFDGIVFDELTRLKNPSGKRFRALHRLLEHVNVRIGLTGSFTSNGLEDVFGQCKIVDEKLLGRSKGAFLQQYFYCANREFNDWKPRPSALPQVMQRIKPATFVLEPGEYKDTLPPLHVVEMRADLPTRDPYEQMKKHFITTLPTTEAIAASAAAVTMKLQQLAGGWVYGEGRSPAWFSTHKFDLLEEVLDGNQRDNTLIFYNFVEELAELKRRYPADLRTLDDGRDVIERWNRREIKLLAAHPKSAGHGLNLQAGGNKIVFLSLPWSLELYEQAIGRLHRSGQRHDVWCYVLLTNKTVDERIWAALSDKRSISDLALEELK
jgi:SNF2 family DNA or RNA helicase